MYCLNANYDILFLALPQMSLNLLLNNLFCARFAKQTCALSSAKQTATRSCQGNMGPPTDVSDHAHLFHEKMTASIFFTFEFNALEGKTRYA